MSKIEQKYTQWMRKQAKPGRDKDPDRHQFRHQQQQDLRQVQKKKCPLCDVEVPADIDGFKAHVWADATNHDRWKDDAAIEDAFRQISIHRQTFNQNEPRPRSGGKRPLPSTADVRDHVSDNDTTPDLISTDASHRGSKHHTSPNDNNFEVSEHHSPKRRLSPPASNVPRRGSSPPTPRSRSHARQGSPTGRQRAGRPHQTTTRALWQPGDESPRAKTTHARNSPKEAQAIIHAQQQQQSEKRKQGILNMPSSPDTTEKLLKQPETRRITQEQLVQEVKTIYSTLVRIETSCIEYNNKHTKGAEAQTALTSEQWQALITLHRTLLHEHHDFFLASQHPSAHDALKRLAAKYAMPARMWRHGIHSFLELLRHRLPESREYMLTFIYLAYSTMALLYETVTAFEETWIECLGDLSRYRMAIEEDDIKDREIWTGVSKHWYSRASDKAPTTGRLYHHLAILARPNALQQLFCYCKSLTVVIPFASARESIITLFDPLMTKDETKISRVDANFVRVQGVFFSGTASQKLPAWREEFLRDLDAHVGRTGRRWLESGYFIGISLSCSLLGFGDASNVLMRIISQRSEDPDIAMDGEDSSEAAPSETFKMSLAFAVETWSIIIKRWGDLNTLPCHHTILVFLLHLSRYPTAMKYIEKKLPWKLIAIMLNYLKKTTQYRPTIRPVSPPTSTSLVAKQAAEGKQYAAPILDQHRPLPDDYALRGLVYTEDYLPRGNFPDDDGFDEEEKYFEQSSMAEYRVKRILWLGIMIARSKKWLTWDDEGDEFGVADEWNVVIEEGPMEIPEAKKMEVVIIEDQG